MKTYMPNESAIERKWYVVDAQGKTLGRLASEVAKVLRGKNKPIFTPHADCGDNVIIVNAEKSILTGRKLEKKMYYHHTGWIGNMKKVKYSTLMKTKPVFVMEKAVKGMLPGNSLGRTQFTRLHVYAGPEHKHAEQKPQAYEV